jgi:preprotein translocase subunit Sec61beta
MVKNGDFYIDCDKLGITSSHQMTAHVMKQLFLDPLDYNMPSIIGLIGKSSRGKSLSALSIACEMYHFRGLDFRDYLKSSVVFVPFDYPDVISAALDKNSKQFSIQIDEGREVIGSKNWQKFTTRAVADINATHRAVKPLLIFVVAQSMKDILRDTRLTLDYMMKFERARSGPAKARLIRFYEDDHDPEKPKIKPMRVYGLVRQNGRIRRVYPRFSFRMPPPDIVKEYKRLEVERKNKIIRGKLMQLIQDLKKEYGQVEQRVDKAVEYYANNQDMLAGVIKFFGPRKVKFNTGFVESMGFTRDEEKDFIIQLRKKLAERAADGVPKLEPSNEVI